LARADDLQLAAVGQSHAWSVDRSSGDPSLQSVHVS